MNAPVVIDCQISPDANVLPMIPPGKTVNEIVTEMYRRRLPRRQRPIDKVGC